MDHLMVDIIEYSFTNFPGMTFCKLEDFLGKIHYFYEKIPVVSSEDIWAYNKNTVLPQKGYIHGEIVGTENSIIKFSTEKWGIESYENVNSYYENWSKTHDDKSFLTHFEANLNLFYTPPYGKIINVFSVCDNKIINDIEYELVHKIKFLVDNHIDSGITKVLFDYKNKNGSQQRAYKVLTELYLLYREQNMEEKEDFIADILDMVSGFCYKGIWEDYLKT